MFVHISSSVLSNSSPQEDHEAEEKRRKLEEEAQSGQDLWANRANQPELKWNHWTVQGLPGMQEFYLISKEWIPKADGIMWFWLVVLKDSTVELNIKYAIVMELI